MNRINNEVVKEIKNKAKKYDKDKCYLFISDIGWENWMLDFCDSEEDELTEKEINKIDLFLTDLFKEVHKEDN